MVGTGLPIPGKVERLIREAVASQAELTFSLPGSGEDFRCRLLDAYSSEGRSILVVTRPTLGGDDVLLDGGSALDCRLVLGLRLFRFESGLIVPSASYLREPVPTSSSVALIAYPHRLEELQRRRYHRAAIRAELVEQVDFFYEGVMVTRKGATVTQTRDPVNSPVHVKDLSGGGLSFSISHDFPHLLSAGERARIDLSIRTTEGTRKLSATVRICHRFTLDDGVGYGASFDGDEPAIKQAKDGALKLVFALQEAAKD